MRHPLTVYKRTATRPKLRRRDRWRAALVIVALFLFQKQADPFHEGLRIVQVGQDHGITQDVALEEAFVELLSTAECATGHIPRQME